MSKNATINVECDECGSEFFEDSCGVDEHWSLEEDFSYSASDFGKLHPSPEEFFEEVAGRTSIPDDFDVSDFWDNYEECPDEDYDYCEGCYSSKMDEAEEKLEKWYQENVAPENLSDIIDAALTSIEEDCYVQRVGNIGGSKVEVYVSIEDIQVDERPKCYTLLVKAKKMVEEVAKEAEKAIEEGSKPLPPAEGATATELTEE